MKNQINFRSGQSLLVIVLLISVVFTIIASASYRLTTETQSAKIQEETIRTLAAADSGIEKALQQLNSLTVGTAYAFSSSQIGIGLSGIDATASTVTVEPNAGRSFISPQVPKDGQYTFYLYEYPNGTTYYNNNLSLFFGPQTTVAAGCGSSRTIPALEITIIRADNSISRSIIEPCGTDPRLEYASGGLTVSNTNNQLVVNGVTQNYGYAATINATSNARLLIVRSLFAPTYLGFDTNSGTLNFQNQGKTIISTAVSTTGISKTVTLFRSHPQLPADFFITSF